MKSQRDPALSSRTAFLAAKERCNWTPLTEFTVLRVAQGDKAVEAARAQIDVNA
jgi:hypothetical protein